MDSCPKLLEELPIQRFETSGLKRNVWDLLIKRVTGFEPATFSLGS